MSFGINGPENIHSIQKSHHTNDGGAGNLGYFKRERKKKKDDKDEQDVFESSTLEAEEEEDSLMEDLNAIGSRIKAWFGLGKKLKENPEV